MSGSIPDEQKHPINYGAFSMLFLIATGFGFKFSIQGIFANASSALVSAFSQMPKGTQTAIMQAPPNITYMYCLLLASMAGYVLSLAFAGAGLATGRGSIFGALTIGVALLPVIYVGYAIFGSSLL